ncbi:CbrC family protein [Nonomuraea sp. 10N515B]|uniref:CbrC family protein n=1 Tax=Nonomuraea sp. 10N515B TaxID=3457422 RepID=UPI003FCCCD0D
MSGSPIQPSPFLLFAAPLTESSEYAGTGRCSLCSLEADPTFDLGIGADVIHECAHCARSFAVPADEHETATVDCPHCRAAMPVARLEDPAVCVSCLRQGKAALTKDTEYGMVRWEDAMRGRTHGVPVLHHAPGFELDMPDGDDWVGVFISSEILLELVRTPTYSTWQGEVWLFCCGQAMTYLGEWGKEDFSAYAPEDPEGAFLMAMRDSDSAGVWEHLPDRFPAHTETGSHVFRCRTCDGRRGHIERA